MKPMNYTTLQASSGLTRESFALLWDNIRAQLREPANTIGYRGASHSSSDDYAEWLGEFISGGIGELGWGDAKGKWRWGRVKDQTNIKKFARYLVGYAAACCRSADRHKAIYEQKKEGKKNVAERKSDNSDPIAIDSDDDFDPKGLEFSAKIIPSERTEEVQENLLARATVTTPASTPVVSATAVSSFAAISVHNVFRTSIVPGGVSKFVYIKEALTIPAFLKAFCEKWDLPKNAVARAIHVSIAGAGFDVDVDEARDWDVVLGMILTNGGSADVLVEFA